MRCAQSVGCVGVAEVEVVARERVLYLLDRVDPGNAFSKEQQPEIETESELEPEPETEPEQEPVCRVSKHHFLMFVIAHGA